MTTNKATRAILTSRIITDHSRRFRRVGNGYACAITFAYEGDLARAAADSDEQVAANVAACERAEGIPVRDWPAIGRSEGKR